MDINNLKQSLIKWNTAYGKTSNEENTLNFYRISYKREIEKKELEQNLISLETWEAYAYTNKMLLEMSFYLPNDQVYAALILNEGNAIVKFLDEFKREYLRFVFVGRYKPEMLFLNTLEYFTYRDDEFYPVYKCETATKYQFTPEGNLRVTKIDKDNFMTVDEAAQLINIEKNWEDYPAKGAYKSLVKLKRWGDNGLLHATGLDLSHFN